jgi:hypothetical protein
MVDGGKITLRIEVDAKEFKRLMKGSTQDLTKFKQQVDNTTPSMNKLGDTATTTAVRFQTLTQGTINLVTSFTQAYTSISNLQKAKTSLQAAAVGVERAIDLQRRKQFMLNEEMAKAQPNMKKVELLTNELATAHDDLAVKQQRVKDQADQVNDTYILFGLNIANVGFSAVQTGASMIQMTKGIKLADGAAKIFNVTTGKYTLIALAAIAAWEGLAFAISTFNKELGDSLSIFKNVQRIMEEFTGASDITLDNYDEKISGVSTSTRDFENSWKSMTKTVQQETSTQTDLVKHWERQYKRSVANIQIEMGRQKQITSGTTGGTQGNFPNAQQGVEARVQETERKVDLLFGFSFPNMPVAFAEEQIKQNITKQDDNVYPVIRNFAAVQGTYVNQKVPLHQFYENAIDYRRELQFQHSMTLGTSGTAVPLTVEGMLLGTTSAQVQAQKPQMQGPIFNPPMDRIERFKQAESGLPDVPSEAERIQAEINKKKAFQQELVDIYETNQGNVTFSWYTASGNIALEILDLETELDVFTQRNPKIKKQTPKSKDERNLEFLSTFIDENTPAYQLRLGSMSSQKRGLFKQRNEKLKQIAIEKFAKENFPRTIQFGTQTFRVGKTSERIGGIFHAGIGSNLMAMTQNKGGTFGMGNRTLGTSEGNMIEALRRAQMATIDPNARRQRTGFDVSGFEQNNYQSNAAGLYAYGATSTLDFMDGTSAFGQGAVAAGAVSVSQVRGSTRFDERNRKVLQDRRRQLDIKDANVNRLRFGGRLRDGFSIWDEGAVIGGYGSAKAYSEAAKRKFYSGVDEARRMLQFFGGGIDSSRIRGRSSRRSEYQRVLNRGTNIKEALTLAGLGYKTIETHLGSRPDRWRVLKMRRDLQEVISFNSNQYAKAETINILQQDFGLTGFTGTTMSLPSLQDRLAAEDERMKSIGLDRTEAFQIIDTAGRGREEIDDRIRFKDRMNSMSTGATVL